MKKLLLLIAVTIAVGTGAVFALQESGPTTAEIQAGLTSTWNVREVNALADVDGEIWTELVWKDPAKGQSAAEQLCFAFPVDKILWENMLGDSQSHDCK